MKVWAQTVILPQLDKFRRNLLRLERRQAYSGDFISFKIFPASPFKFHTLKNYSRRL